MRKHFSSTPPLGVLLGFFSPFQVGLHGPCVGKQPNGVVSSGPKPAEVLNELCELRASVGEASARATLRVAKARPNSRPVSASLRLRYRSATLRAPGKTY